MPETPNHGYNVPNEGEQDWHVPLNENFQQYDTDIEIRDEDANRGNYQPKAGAKFLATDTATVYLGDGSSWQSAFDLGGVESIGGVGADPSGDLGLESPDGSIDLDLDASGNTIGLSVADEIAAASAVESIAGVGPDDNGNVDLTSPDGSISLDFDPSGNAIGMSIARPPTFAQLNPNNDFLGVGRETQVTSEEVFGIQSDFSGFGGMYVNSTDTSGGQPFYGYATGESVAAYHYWDEADSEWILSLRSGSVVVDEDGNLTASGNKNFAQTVDTDDGERKVVYTASEAPTARTETSGVGALEDGRAEIDLPDHFGWVTDEKEPLVVQTTPYGGERGLKVVERSTDRIVLEDLDGKGDYEFAYTVKGTRAGHADKEVVREPSASVASDDPPAPAND